MRSLFLRIFLSVCLATALIGGSLVVLAVTTDPYRADFAPHQRRMERAGREMIDRYHEGGAAALREWERGQAGNGAGPVFLFHAEQGPLTSGRIPRSATRLASRSLATGEREARRGRHGLWLALPLDDEYVMVTEVPPPSAVQRFLDPFRLGPRLGAAFVIIVIVSYLLARSVSDPIRKLRDATRRLAAGDLDARVARHMGSRNDEITALGRDFDGMAERIGTLLDSQRRLLRDISHELRSPLARLGVALELARHKAGTQVQADLNRIERETERLNQLIGELLTLTLLESKQGPSDRVALRLDELVERVADDADFEAANRGRAVRLVAVEPVTVLGYPELLRRAVENVMRNAIRFTAEGTTVEVRVVLTRGGPVPGARVEVRDHGPGVPEDELVRIFQPLYRVSEARERPSGGAGLGLAIAGRAVALHGGTIVATNAPGGGLRVVVDLPRDSGLSGAGARGESAPLPFGANERGG